MAIYNIDNIRSINEDKSDIARYYAMRDAIQRAKSYHKGPKIWSNDDYDKKLDYARASSTRADNEYWIGDPQTARDKRVADRQNQRIVEEEEKRKKIRQAKLKEAAQYILDVLDEQEYYDEYDNSNDYYYYE